MRWVKHESNHEPCKETAKTWNIAIKFHLYYFVVGFTCSLLSFFPEVICFMKYAPAQCSPKAVHMIVGFFNLSKFFDLDLTIDELYMSQSSGFIDPNLLKFVCKQHKAIYGLKQAQRLNTFLIQSDFVQSSANNSMFTFHKGSHLPSLCGRHCFDG